MSSFPGVLADGRRRAPRLLPSIHPALIACIALLLALITGRYLANGHLSIGLGVVLAVCYAPLVLLDLTVALAVYVAILFIQDTAALSVGPNSVGVLVFLGWIGTFITRSARPAVLREQSHLIQLLAVFALWLALSTIWSTDASATTEALQSWLIAVLAFILTVTTLRGPRDVAVIGIAFIVGAVISVLFGISNGGLTAAASAEGANATTLDGRFTGGGGDPNVQAAGYLIAMFLCAGFWSLARQRRHRVALLVAFVIVTTGFFATQSRGGLIALAVATVAGLAVLPRQRKRLLGLTAAAGIGLAIISVVNPGAIERMTDFGGGTSGRNDLWKVAWTIFSQHHWVGIGLNNFEAIEPHYALSSGTLQRVELVAEVPHLVHNLYLQLLTETGVVGLALFLVVIFGCLRAAWLAARRFDRLGQRGYADLARAALMAELAMLAAQFFISDGFDWRLWILLGLGPVLLSIARRTPLPASGDGPPATRRRLRRAAQTRRFSASSFR
jgi:O-antigen ligase